MPRTQPDDRQTDPDRLLRQEAGTYLTADGRPDDRQTHPDRLLRQEAGTYLTANGRFEVRRSDAGWFMLDTQQRDELGQPLLRGPFPSLNAARNELSGARKITVLKTSIRDGSGDVDSRAAHRRISPHAGGSRVSPTSKSSGSKSSGTKKKAAPKKKTTAKSTTKKK